MKDDVLSARLETMHPGITAQTLMDASIRSHPEAWPIVTNSPNSLGGRVVTFFALRTADRLIANNDNFF